MGGLSKKASLINELQRDTQRPTLVVAGGNLLFPSDRLDADAVEKAKITAGGVLEATQKMGATFAAVGSRDLAAGPSWLLKSHKPPTFSWLSANLVQPTSRKPFFTPVLHLQVGGVKIAIVGVTDHTVFTEKESDFLVKNWRDSLPAVVAAAAKEADCVLLLSNYPYSENQEIARNIPSIDLILQIGHAIGNMDPVPVNNAMIAQTEIRGKYLGVLEIDWLKRGSWHERTAAPSNEEKKQTATLYSNRFIPLKQSLASDPEIEALVKQTQRRLDQLQHSRTQ